MTKGVLSLELFDVEAAEKAEKSIDAFINARSKAKENANREQELWKESTRRVNEKRRNRNRWEWIRFHGNLHRLYTQSAAEHAAKRARLLREAGYEPDDERTCS
jgi:flavin-dependent dehydrogenase